VAADWGLVVGKPFYIVSALPSRRYIDVVKNNLVIKTPNGRASQKWFFDYKSRTIRNVGDKGKTLHMFGDWKSGDYTADNV